MYNPQLDAFVQVADCAASTRRRRRCTSSTAVIKQINALEKHLDLQLVFLHQPWHHPTEAGKVLYKHAKGIMDYSQRAIQEARLAAEAAATTFCVGTSILNPCKPFMDLWYQVSENLPGFKPTSSPSRTTTRASWGDRRPRGEVRLPGGGLRLPPVAGPVQLLPPGGTATAWRCLGSTPWPGRSASPSRTFTGTP